MGASRQRRQPFWGVFGGLAAVLFVVSVIVSLSASRCRTEPKASVPQPDPSYFIPAAGILPDGGWQVIDVKPNGQRTTFLFDHDAGRWFTE